MGVRWRSVETTAKRVRDCILGQLNVEVWYTYNEVELSLLMLATWLPID